VTTTNPAPFDPLLTPAEVASAFAVDPKTVTRWAKAGRLRSVKTLGGHRRYYRSDIEALLRAVEEVGQ
jgi:excisionase family DNA binding protein